MNEQLLKKVEESIIKSRIVEDPLFLQEYEKAYKLTALCYYNIDWSTYQGPMLFHSTRNNLQLAKDYLKTIDKKYSRLLQKDYMLGKIDIDRKHKKSLYIRKPLALGSFFSIISEKIVIEEEDSLKDSQEIVHEYLHKLPFYNIKKDRKTTNSYTHYREMISILGEFRYLAYLEEKEIISKSELQLLRDIRKKRYCHIAKSYLLCEPFVNTFLKTGELTEEGIRKYTNFKSSIADIVLEYVCKNFEQVPTLAYRYLLGTPLAATLCDISNEDFKMLIENLNQMEKEEYDILLQELSHKPVLPSMKNQFERKSVEKVKRR